MQRTAAAIWVMVSICMGDASAGTGGFTHLTGHYSDEDLVKGAAPKVLPMTFLYDADDRLVPADKWPAELSEVKKHVGDGYCCVSEQKPIHENEPPADCVRRVFGTDLAANFNGLVDSGGMPILMAEVPRHKWLLVVYSATWCAPCLKESAALAQFFKTSAHADDYVWITLDVTRMIEAKAIADAAKPR